MIYPKKIIKAKSGFDFSFLKDAGNASQFGSSIAGISSDAIGTTNVGETQVQKTGAAVLGGAATGASIGSVAGPLGTAIGGGLGAIGGLIGNAKAKKEARRKEEIRMAEEAQQRSLQGRLLQESLGRTGNSLLKMGGKVRKYAEGGSIKSGGDKKKPMDFNELSRMIAEEKGGRPEQYFDLVDRIGAHESKYIPEGANHYIYNDPKSNQLGGPAKGLGFEPEGLKTAIQRAKNYFEAKGIPVPKWVKENIGEKDAHKFTLDQQRMLMLLHFREHPKANLSDIVDGKKTIEEFWADYYWAGDPEDRSDRIKSFKETQQAYKPIQVKEKLRVRQSFKNLNLQGK